EYGVARVSWGRPSRARRSRATTWRRTRFGRRARSEASCTKGPGMRVRPPLNCRCPQAQAAPSGSPEARVSPGGIERGEVVVGVEAPTRAAPVRHQAWLVPGRAEGEDTGAEGLEHPCPGTRMGRQVLEAQMPD